MAVVGAQVRTAVEVPRWALAFYRRHLLMIVGVSLVASAQRVVAVLWSAQLPTPLNVVLEGVTVGVRVLLPVLIVRLVFFRDGGVEAIEGNGWAGARAFVRTRWPSLIVQMLMIAALTVLFDVIPDQLVGPQIPDDVAGAYWAALLAVKNPTIIAFTVVWLVVAARQITLYPQPLPAHASHDAASGQPRPVGTGPQAVRGRPATPERRGAYR
jgi:hypothetical protein